MKKFYYLLNHEFKIQMKLLGIVIGVMLVLQSISLIAVVSNENNRYLRFEELLDMALIPIMFIVAFIAVLLINALSYYRNCYGSKSIYALLTLPQSRSKLYYAKLGAGFINILVIWAAQFIGIFINYFFYNTSTYDAPHMTNALLLAFTRSGFLRILYPLIPMHLLVGILMIVTVAVLVLFLVLTERIHKYFWMLIPIPWIIAGIVYKAWSLFDLEISIWWIIIAALLLNTLLIKLSLRMINMFAKYEYIDIENYIKESNE